VSPHPCNPTPRTELRLGPWISSAPYKDLLDLHCNKDYQDSWVLGVSTPAFQGGALPRKDHRPISSPIKRASTLRPIYLDNPCLLVNLLRKSPPSSYSSILKNYRQIQKRYINYMQSVITLDPKIEELLQWESDKDMLAWLDNL
jgi:hypothetical protein